MLDRTLEFSIDGTVYAFTAADTPVAVAWYNQRPVEFVRRSCKGDPLIKVRVKTPPKFFGSEWKDGCHGFLVTHAEVLSWHPGTVASTAARNHVETGKTSVLRARMASSRLAIEALDTLLEHLEPRARNGDTDRIAKARAYVELTAEQKPDLKQIAQANGFSVGVLQRRYRDVYGRTVIEHQRQLLLQLAMESLRTEDISVAQASVLAGYSNPTNFTAAFVKLFGMRPSQIRNES